MLDKPKFKGAFPFQENVLALPVRDLNATAEWYANAFGMTEIKRFSEPNPTVILKRDDAEIGFSINGSDPTQDGAAILVSGIDQIKEEFEAKGVEIGNWRTDEREGKTYQVFFVVAPDGLCFYFHQPI